MGNSFRAWSQVAIKTVLDFPRWGKRLIALILDGCLCVLATWLAFYLRIDQFVGIGDGLLKPSILSMLIAIPVFVVNGLYRAIFRYSDWTALRTVAISISIYGIIYMTIVMVLRIEGTPRTLGIIQPLILFILVSVSRLAVTWTLGESYQRRSGLRNKVAVLVYGAGSSGRQLAESLRHDNEFKMVGFLDDDPALHGRVMRGYRVYSPSDIEAVSSKQDVKFVLLAMPSMSRKRRGEVISDLARLSLTVRTLPAVGDLAHGRVRVDDLRELDIDDLLGRDQVEPDRTLMSRQVAGRCVLISGAGGSIGSELCRQVLSLGPGKLVLVENSEFALFQIHGQLIDRLVGGMCRHRVELVPVLCSIDDRSRVKFLLDLHKPDIIFHAAAYKHVPLVEFNPISGVRNNIFGTMAIAQAAAEANVTEFVLVSTDKAVRPTNIMGATKRVSEMILQALDARGDSVTKYSMVRFGNVLESSGSVIPLFKEQIRSGGPVTVTHPEVTRYFMTIPEAAELVIQASGLASGGDVFVLDMGKPVKILELAERMIQLSGLSVKDLNEPDGDIEIEITGLRDGEKLYEELLIGDSVDATGHRRIMSARETFLDWEHLDENLAELGRAVSSNDAQLSREILVRLVPELPQK